MGLLDQLNDKQREAVLTTQGPLLILAGAGSGKTRTIIHRIAYILEQGMAWPSQILAITFTNKAAAEMRQRIAGMDVPESNRIWIHTFHAMCARIMRRYAGWLGYEDQFVIYDTDDQKRLYKQIAKSLNLDDKQFSFGLVSGRISDAKDQFISPEVFARDVPDYDVKNKKIAEFYLQYQKQLKANNAMDFDDLIYNTVKLFKENPDILETYQNQFKYILVDEYQDTNHAQYLLVEMLSGGYGNLCVCGDDDQSIYGWRGADITNILDFEKSFPNAKVIKLEQNYRSTQYILEAANGVIANNRSRKDKALWTDQPGKDKIRITTYENGHEEAKEIVDQVRALRKEGYTYGDCAILYRTNAQSRLFEEAFMRAGIPYQLVGGTGFYARQEIKDIITYLHLIVNPKDDLGFRRIINMPKRGIGNATMEKLQEYAEFKGIGLMEAVHGCDQIPQISVNVLKKLKEFSNMMQEFAVASQVMGVAELLQLVIKGSGYYEMLEAGKMEKSENRLDNLEELVSSAADFEQTSDDKSVTAFLETVALSSETDHYDGEDLGKVLLMTLHNAKGLEFPVVFMPGMEEGTFPNIRAIHDEGEAALEEERRICYVGITRAKRKLFMSWAKVRTLYGNTEGRLKSRFMKEVPETVTEVEDRTDTLSYAADQENTMASARIGTGKTRFSGVKDGVTGGAAHSATMAALKSSQQHPKDAGTNTGSDFKLGDKAKHKKFGIGTIVELDGDKVSVAFPGMGIKKLKTNFIEKA